MDALFDLFTNSIVRPWWHYVMSYAPWMALVFLIERFVAARRADGAGAWFNLRYIAGAIVVSFLLVGFGRQWIQPGVDLLQQSFAPVRSLVKQAPAWAQLLLQVAVLDFFYYWTHRAQHTFGPLWRIHELHHSDPSFNVTTTLRVHWLEELMKLFTVLVPAALLVQAPSGAPVLLAWAAAAWLFFIHANARISFGPLNRVLVNPAVHRVHHSVEPEHFDKNFAAYFSFWDCLFGTYAEPPKGRWPEVGTHGPAPTSMLAAHLRPFWRPRVEG